MKTTGTAHWFYYSFAVFFLVLEFLPLFSPSSGGFGESGEEREKNFGEDSFHWVFALTLFWILVGMGASTFYILSQDRGKQTRTV